MNILDKYEFNVKAEQINKMIEKKDFATAAKIADGIDWKRVKSVKMLTNVGGIYAQVGRYEDAKEILLMAFQRAPMGRRLAYKLTEVNIAAGNIEEAEMYYHEFLEIAPKDIRRYELLYRLEKKKGKPIEELIKILEEYKETEFDDIWAYELARLYHKAGMTESCIAECDEIILWFGEGEYVEKAKDLKALYVPPECNNHGKYQHHYEPHTTYISRMNQLEFPQQEQQETEINQIQEIEEQREIEESFSEEESWNHTQYYQPIDRENDEAEEEEFQDLEETEKGLKEQRENTEEIENIEDTEEIEDIEEKFDTQEAEAPQGEEEQCNIYRIPRKYLQTGMPIEEIVQKYGKVVDKTERRKEDSYKEEEEAERQKSSYEEEEADTHSAEDIDNSLHREKIVQEKEDSTLKGTIQEMMNEISEITSIPTELSEERKQTFAQFLHMQGLEAQLAEIFDEIEQRRKERTTSFLGNIIIIGEHKSGKTKLAVDLLKEINKITNKKGKKMAKISGGRLNNKDIAETILRLNHADLLIEQAGEMNKTTIKELLNVMADYTAGMLVILEDTKENIEYLLKENPEITTHFNYQITLKECDIADWVEKARQYAKGLDYAIDEMATLALSAKIDAIYAKKTSIEIEDIKEIVNKAIEKSEKKNLKKLFDTVFTRKYKDSDLTILREVDFE